MSECEKGYRRWISPNNKPTASMKTPPPTKPLNASERLAAIARIFKKARQRLTKPHQRDHILMAFDSATLERIDQLAKGEKQP